MIWPQVYTSVGFPHFNPRTPRTPATRAEMESINSVYPKTIPARKWGNLLALALVVVATWLPRGLALDRFVTTDEVLWLTRSGNFYYALTQRDYKNTYQREHPGVTVMWAGMLGFLRAIPNIATAALASS